MMFTILIILSISLAAQNMDVGKKDLLKKHSYDIAAYVWPSRFEMFKPGVVTNNTPENFEKALKEVNKFVDEHPGQAPLITINSWNKWTETSYLMPFLLFP